MFPCYFRKEISSLKIMIFENINRFACRHDMARSQVIDEGYGLQTWKVVLSTLLLSRRQLT